MSEEFHAGRKGNTKLKRPEMFSECCGIFISFKGSHDASSAGANSDWTELCVVVGIFMKRKEELCAECSDAVVGDSARLEDVDEVTESFQIRVGEFFFAIFVRGGGDEAEGA